MLAFLETERCPMHSTRFVALIALAFLVSVTSAQAQQSATTIPVSPTRDAQAVLLLQTIVKAMGGGLIPSDSTANGTVIETVGSDSQNGTIQVLTRGTAESLESINLPDLTQTTVYANLLAGQTNGPTAQQQISGQLAATSQTVFYPLPFIAGALGNSDVSIQYVGQETVDGAATQHVRVWNTYASKARQQTLARYSVHDLWIGASNGMPLKISFTRQASGGQAFKTLVEFDFSNYQQVGSFAYPSQVNESLNGTLWLTVSIQTMSFNTGLQDTQFQVNCNNN